MTAQLQKPTAQLNKTTNETNVKSCLDGSFASVKPAAVTAQATLAFQIAYTALWNTQEFSATEIAQATELIKELLERYDNPAKAFNNFVQRVLLARQYINTHPGSYAPIPTEWLSTTNKNGFAGTQRWLDAVDNLRSSIPTYKQALKAFAEAVQETATSRKAADFHYWRSYFIQQNAQGLLNLFLSTIANMATGRLASGQLAVGSWQLAEGSGQWAGGSWQWAVGSGQEAVGSGRRGVASGKVFCSYALWTACGARMLYYNLQRVLTGLIGQMIT